MRAYFHQLYLDWAAPAGFDVFFAWVTTLVLLVVSSYVLGRLIQVVLAGAIHRVVKKTSNEWDDYLLNKKFFQRLASALPTVTGYFLLKIFLEPDPVVFPLVLKTLLLLMCVTFSAFVDQVITNVEQGVLALRDKNRIPIRSYVQVAKILLFLVAGILAISIVLDQNPLIILSGIGALTAVLLLVFRDSILGFVASLQLGSNDLVQVGDVIEIPGQGIDGEVIDIALSVVKIRSGDNTIFSLPTYQLVSAPFKNWRHVTERGARRVKLAFPVDSHSLGPVKTSLQKALQKQGLWAVPPGRSDMTNLEAFRYWAQQTLETHNDLVADMARVVRIGDPVGRGVPVEMVFYTKLTNYPDWEHLHSHLLCLFLARLDDFGLTVFQEASGTLSPAT